MYEISFLTDNHTEIWGWKVPLPDMPLQKKMVNYGLPEEEQKFVREKIPPNLTTLPANEQKEWVKTQFHKRKHGVWYLIKGQPIYFPGKYWMFLNYWHTESGKLPEFRYYQLQYFWFWDMVCRDPNCYGAYFLKPRRAGFTELALFEMWEYASRVRSKFCGMQNLSGDDAKADYLRLVKGHDKMIWFFKPINSGSDRPQNGLRFEMPAEVNTANNVKSKYGLFSADSDKVNILDSRITYESTQLGKYDGQRLHRYRMGEAGKQKSFRMNPLEQLEIIKPCCSEQMGMVITGKIVVETTIEDYESKTDSQSVSSLLIAQELWQQSEQSTTDKNGQTLSGLKGCFFNALDCAQVDEWGFPKRVETESFIRNKLDTLKGKDRIQFARKYPLDVEDAFTPDVDVSLFDAEVIGTRLKQVTNNQDCLGRNKIGGEAYRNPCVRGNLVWAVKDIKVEFIPNDAGKWIIEQRPIAPNKYVIQDGKKYPASVHAYCSGTDPVDQKATEVVAKHKSMAGIIVKRRYDVMEDGAIEVEVEGDNGEKDIIIPLENIPQMKTRRYVCSYNHRPDDPEEYYEDLIKTCFYYGCKVLGEKQKGKNCIAYFAARGYYGYLDFASREVNTSTNNPKEPWLPSSDGVVTQYIERLQIMVKKYGMGINNRDVLTNLRYFERSKRTRYDLTVAMGYAELADRQVTIQKTDEEKGKLFIRKFALHSNLR